MEGRTQPRLLAVLAGEGISSLLSELCHCLGGTHLKAEHRPFSAVARHNADTMHVRLEIPEAEEVLEVGPGGH